MHDHAHHHHGHEHGRAPGHSHAHGHGPTQGWRFGVAMIVNLGFVIAEAAFGLLAHSTALLADAGHNLSDVLGLALAGGAAWLTGAASGTHRTYGFGKATILAALANALLLVFACGAIVAEAVTRLSDPQPLQPVAMMVVAAVGVAVNAGTAMLFLAGRKRDLNVRAAFQHMIADAAVSVGVILAGGLIVLTGRAWIDPVTSLAIVAMIGLGAWGLLKESLNLAMDVAPTHVDVTAVRRLLEDQPGVAEVHDLHIWNMSTTETALTAHLVRAEGIDGDFLCNTEDALRRAFGLQHVTLQVETAPCAGRHDLHP
jgi:cobalt-zinc-cadmium efflux system protein